MALPADSSSTPSQPENNSTNTEHLSPANSSTPKKSNTIWWIIGGSCLVLMFAAAILIYLIFAWFIPQNPTITSNNNNTAQFDQDKYQQEIKDELDKIGNLEDEIAQLEEKIKEQEKDKETPDSAKEQKNGIIEGSLSYPSEQIPDLTVCAEEIGHPANTICTENLIDNPKYTAGRGYQLTVAPGDYHVYSYFNDKSYLGYYTEFVPCGLDISCPSHNKITVNVTPGSHQTGIDPVDWYMP